MGSTKESNVRSNARSYIFLLFSWVDEPAGDRSMEVRAPDGSFNLISFKYESKTRRLLKDIVNYKLDLFNGGVGAALGCEQLLELKVVRISKSLVLFYLCC